ncbi:MAG: UDP-2,3-diacylglucosamine diphosphatase LpxI [Puniceicoccales bacterium]|nr:UDP-2,3-diacylglucosamine diphosphatase LpxI [Puniceicoccales bacterium]
MSFTRKNLPKGERVALIAGRGDYPVSCAKNMMAAGHDMVVIAVDDDVNAGWLDSFPAQNVTKISVGQISKLLKALKRFGVKFAIMAGQVKPKKLFRGMLPDLKALWMLATLKEHHAESIFGAIAEEIANIGVELLDARSFMEEDLATIGPMTSRRSAINEKSLQLGISTAREIARLNIGQCVIVNKGTIVAVEDFAGTDDLINRAGKFNLKDAIFIKTAKYRQDFRFDVPVFGMQTLENLNGANIKYAALEAQNVIILDKKNVLAHAAKLGIDIVGFE